MTTSLTSVGTIIAKMYTDLRLNDPSFETDAIEWAGEALGLIGTGVFIEKKVSTLTVESYAAVLPSDMFFLQEVYHLKEATSPTDDTASRVPLASSQSSTLVPSLDQAITTNFPNSYIIKGRYIHTSFEEGFVHIVYDGIAIDTDGFPFIPDNVEFKSALFWYILRQMMIGGYEHSNRQIDFLKADEMWQRYCGQARGIANLPDVPTYENFYNNWVRLLPSTNRRDGGFSAKQENARYGRIFYPNT